MRDTIAAPEPRWHWRNCRSLSLSFCLRVWPWVAQAGRDEDVYGGRRWIAIGPFSVMLEFDIGNSSSENRLVAATGLSESEAWDRACRFEGRPA